MQLFSVVNRILCVRMLVTVIMQIAFPQKQFYNIYNNDNVYFTTNGSKHNI